LMPQNSCDYGTMRHWHIFDERGSSGEIMSSKAISRLKMSVLIGFCISVAALLGIVVMFASAARHWPYLSFFGVVFAGLGTPGIFAEAYVSAALSGNPHSGGTPLGMILIFLPLNTLFYSVLVYAVIAIRDRIRGNS
jgi:fucose permease